MQRKAVGYSGFAFEEWPWKTPQNWGTICHFPSRARRSRSTSSSCVRVSAIPVELLQCRPELMLQNVLPHLRGNFFTERSTHFRHEDGPVVKDFAVPVVIGAFKQLPSSPLTVPFEVAELRQVGVFPSVLHRLSKEAPAERMGSGFSDSQTADRANGSP